MNYLFFSVGLLEIKLIPIELSKTQSLKNCALTWARDDKGFGMTVSS